MRNTIDTIRNNVRDLPVDTEKLLNLVNPIISHITEYNNSYFFNSVGDITRDEYLSRNGNWLKANPVLSIGTTISTDLNNHTIATLRIHLTKELQPSKLVIESFNFKPLFTLDESEITSILLSNSLKSDLSENQIKHNLKPKI